MCYISRNRFNIAVKTPDTFLNATVKLAAPEDSLSSSGNPSASTKVSYMLVHKMAAVTMVTMMDIYFSLEFIFSSRLLS